MITMLNRSLRIIVLNTLLIGLFVPVAFAVATAAQTTAQTGVAIQRGYRTGYSDGYMAGYRDTVDSLTKDFSRHKEYAQADRAYNKDYGSMDDYKNGYQQGFQIGYSTGFDRKSFESSLPTGLKRRDLSIGDGPMVATKSVVQDKVATTDSRNTDRRYEAPIAKVDTPANTDQSAAVSPEPTSYQSLGNAIVIIPRDTELIIELQDDLDTERNREGDKFTAKIVSPSELSGATVEGRISKIVKPGRIKRRSEMLLSFDRIVLNDSRWTNFSASLTEVFAVKGDNVKNVDTEGTAIGQGSIKSDLVKVGGATGAGALIGGVVGGPVGVAVGAGVGAAFGVGAVVIERGKHIRLNHNQQLRIKTAYESQIR